MYLSPVFKVGVVCRDHERCSRLVSHSTKETSVVLRHCCCGTSSATAPLPHIRPLHTPHTPHTFSHPFRLTLRT
jgi:hypothetical protein